MNVFTLFSFGITLHLLLLRAMFLSMLSQLETLLLVAAVPLFPQRDNLEVNFLSSYTIMIIWSPEHAQHSWLFYDSVRGSTKMWKFLLRMPCFLSD